MTRDVHAEPVLATTRIQGDILPGLLKKNELLLFFRIDSAADFLPFLKGLPITSMETVLDQRAEVADRRTRGVTALIPAPGLNVAFTFTGLTKLGVAGLSGAPGLAEFEAGMAARQAVLDDPDPTHWRSVGPERHADGVFVLAGASRAEIDDTIALHLAPAGANGWTVVREEAGVVRPDPVHGHEHFGYADGVSQPGVRGTTPDGSILTPSVDADDRPEQGALGQDLLWPGEFVLGYPGQDPQLGETDPDFARPGPLSVPPVPFMDQGSFLVFRRLAQKVPEFDASVKALAKQTTGADAVSAELLGAQLVGRWKSGAALELSPVKDDLSLAEGTPRENDFEFGDDREGARCPWAAHVRKAYPRDDVRHTTTPSELEVAHAEAFTQTHRMMRRGIAYGPELSHAEALSGHTTQQRGLLFLCYVSSIAEQFEFVQQAWVDAQDFPQVGSGADPIIGQPHPGTLPFLGAAPFSEDPTNKPQLDVAHFVTMEGGDYFFAPALDAIQSL
ncbi:Dyp-type peroxidase [Microlunatus antarcticus]|uniref:Dyp-type peroxidase family n=1 Tax=Microlunatus antarcticus TaxID=53388 RepID=A0A7W5JTE0_9ACTN|nr:Dyp-type peroxidase [Microlunatus antarcticus]MBB3325977.1 Dyp-type peroxidase family [Microlunatus antarcticus]